MGEDIHVDVPDGRSDAAIQLFPLVSINCQRTTTSPLAFEKRSGFILALSEIPEEIVVCVQELGSVDVVPIAPTMVEF